MRLIFIILFIFSASAFAGDGTRVSNVKCKGGWVKAGMSKLEVISACGQPIANEVTSGGLQVKSENLLFKIKRKDYIFYFYGGKLQRMEMPK